MADVSKDNVFVAQWKQVLEYLYYLTPYMSDETLEKIADRLLQSHLDSSDNNNKHGHVSVLKPHYTLIGKCFFIQYRVIFTDRMLF